MGSSYSLAIEELRDESTPAPPPRIISTVSMSDPPCSNRRLESGHKPHPTLETPAVCGRISKIGRSHARAMLVEAAWAAAKAPGPLHAFFVRIRAKRGHQVAAVAVARKLAVLVWHMLTKQADYQWARPSLVAHKIRAVDLLAGKPQKKGNKSGPAAYAYNVKKLRDQEMRFAEQAQKGYERFVDTWRHTRLMKKARGRLNPAGSSKVV